MPNGFHSHYCPRHKEQKDCAQITHCRRDDTALCADCVYDDMKRKENEEREKDWPSDRQYLRLRSM